MLGPFQKKEVQRTKQRYDRKTKCLLLEPNDVVLVRKMSHTGKHKIQNRVEDEEYIIVSQHNSAIPMYIVQPVVGGQQRTLHRNLLLPLGYTLNEVEDSDEEIEVASPVEVKRSFDRVRKPFKVDQIDKSIAIVSEPSLTLVILLLPFVKNLLNFQQQMMMCKKVLNFQQQMMMCKKAS